MPISQHKAKERERELLGGRRGAGCTNIIGKAQLRQANLQMQFIARNFRFFWLQGYTIYP